MSNREDIRPGSTTVAATLYKSRDKYGRTTTTLQRGVCGPVAIIITLPKVFAENHGGERYLVADRRLDADLRPRSPEVHAEALRFVKRADAIEYARSLDVPVA